MIPKMRVKDDSISHSAVSPQIYWALTVASQVYAEAGHELVITSLNDGYHSHASLHYSGNAADVRIRGLADPKAIRDELAKRLGRDFDVVLEHNHIHIEYQPKRR